MTVLNAYTRPGEILLLWIVMIAAGLIGGSYCWSKHRTAAACFLLAVLAVGILGCVFRTPVETRYECLFDKGLSYTEISEQWNVVGQRGDIWVVTAKDGTDVPAE